MPPLLSTEHKQPAQAKEEEAKLHTHILHTLQQLPSNSLFFARDLHPQNVDGVLRRAAIGRFLIYASRGVRESVNTVCARARDPSALPHQLHRLHVAVVVVASLRFVSAALQRVCSELGVNQIILGYLGSVAQLTVRVGV